MKITKLLDSGRVIEELIRRKSSVCPCCGETRPSDLYDYNGMRRNYGVSIKSTITWIGSCNDGVFSFLKGKYHWKVLRFRCYTCGAEWESDPFPLSLYDEEDGE